MHCNQNAIFSVVIASQGNLMKVSCDVVACSFVINTNSLKYSAWHVEFFGIQLYIEVNKIRSRVTLYVID